MDDEKKEIDIDTIPELDVDTVDTIPNLDTSDVSEEHKPSEASELFGKYVKEENKWERKNRLREEKEKKKIEKKRAKYKDVDDDTYESMKARPGHVFFGVFCVLLLISSMTLAVLGIFKLAIHPAYEKVGEKEKNLQVEGIATDGDGTDAGSIVVLQGVSEPASLTDTWVEQETATQSDANDASVTEEGTQSDEQTTSEE